MSHVSNQRIHAGGLKALPTSRRKRSTLTLVSPGRERSDQDLIAAGRSSDELLREIVNVCASNVSVLDESGTTLYASKGWCAFEQSLRVSSSQDGKPHYFARCKTFSEPTNGDPINTLEDDLDCLLKGQETEFQKKYSYDGFTGSRQFVMHATRLNLPGSPLRILITHDDVTSPREALRKSEASLSRLLDTTKIFVWEAEPKSWQFSYVSEQAEKALGYSAMQWREANFLALHVHPDDQHLLFSCGEEHLQATDQFDVTFRMFAKDGRVVWLHNLVSVSFEDGQPTRMFGYMVDISERKRSEEALRNLGGRLIVAQENERSRIACELHDDFNQRMALLSINLEQLGNRIDEPIDHQIVEKLQAQVKELSTDIHRLAYRLHPSKLDHLGLGAAVRSLCEEVSAGSKIRIEFQRDGFPANLPKDIKLCLFRIAQEGLRNCVKHSGAQAIHVMLVRSKNAVRLSVSDNGCGLDTKSAKMGSGLGFISMNERLRVVGGEMHIYSRPRHGTRIEATVPLNEKIDPI